MLFRNVAGIVLAQVIRTIVVDDHEFLVQGLIAVFGQTRDIRVIEHFADGAELLGHHSSRNYVRPDVILMDITMRQTNGLDVLRRILTWQSPPPVVLFSMHAEEVHAAAAIAAGARGYVTKDAPMEELIRAVHAVAAGQTYLSARGQSLVRAGSESVGSLDVSPGSSRARLSEQERRVFILLGQGLSVKEIAFELGVSVKSVSTYKTRLMQKLGVGSLVELARLDLVL